jgi:acetoin utilization protein AcuB
MLVKNWMSKNPVTTFPSATIPEAQQVMRGSRTRHLPVVEKGRLVGIISQEDILRVSASPASTLSAYELNYLLDKITVEQAMTKEVITVGEDEVLEEAGHMMVKNEISSLPVMRGNELVGIITESNLFIALLALFGARQTGVRMTVKIPEVPGTIAKITSAVTSLGGTFVALGVVEELEMGFSVVTMKIQNATRDDLVKAVQPLVTEVLDIREGMQHQEEPPLN